MATNPYQIAGNLPWGGAGGQMLQGLSGPPQQAMAQLGQNYAAGYGDSLAMNKGGYQNILAGYQNVLAGQTAAQDAVSAGYDALGGQVEGFLANAGERQRQQIQADYVRNSGAMSQQLINRGLGNTTVQSSAMRGLDLDRARASVDLASQIAGVQADYKTRIGTQGLQQQQAAAMNNSQTAQNQLQWMNSVNALYPNAAMYGGLASQFGAASEAEKQQKALQKASAPTFFGGGGGAPGPRVGYVPGVTPGYGTGGGGFSAPAGGGGSLFSYGAPSGAGYASGAFADGAGLAAGFSEGFGSGMAGAYGSSGNDFAGMLTGAGGAIAGGAWPQYDYDYAPTPTAPTPMPWES